MGEPLNLDLEDKHIEEAVYTALGAASVCWEKMEGTGVFQDDRARAIGEQLMSRINNELGRTIDAEPNIQSELAALLNRYSAESVSGTPDFILARYMIECLKAYNEAVSQRAEWRGELVDFKPVVAEE